MNAYFLVNFSEPVQAVLAMYKWVCLLVSIFLLSSSVCFAEEDCGKLPTTGDQRACAERQLERAVKDMHRAYATALSAYTPDPKQKKDLDQDDINWYKRVHEKLIVSQKEWLLYSERAWAVVAEQYRGGTIVSVVVPLCKKELTEQRTKWLGTFATDSDTPNRSE